VVTEGGQGDIAATIREADYNDPLLALLRLTPDL
jgi:hypothetical protein